MASVLIAVAAIGVLVVAAAAVAARRGRRAFVQANEVVRGTPTRAPAGWAGDHSPEARLHRRLRDAVASVPRDDVALFEARVAIERLALAVDDQLVTAAALPERFRAEPLAQVTAAVEAVEQAAARIAANELGQHHTAAVESALQQLHERVELLAQAREELDRGEPGTDLGQGGH